MAPDHAVDMRSGAVGQPRPALARITPCGVTSPHKPGVVRVGRGERPVAVECNRPAGHSGNHMCLLGSFERLAEWGQCEVIK